MTKEQLDAAVTAGHLKASKGEVTISAKSSPTGKDESRAYDKFEALDAEGMAILCDGKLEPATPAPAEGKDERTDAEKASGACDHFNYGFDLAVRQRVRGQLASDIEGPAKIIRKTAEDLVKAGLYDSVEAAAEFVKAQRAAKGLAV